MKDGKQRWNCRVVSWRDIYKSMSVFPGREEVESVKTYEAKSAKLIVASGKCDLCGQESVGTLDWGAEEKTFFCAACGKLEYEETLDKAKAQDSSLSSGSSDVPYSC